jgi:CRP-like cAMP-binding protein
MVTIESSEASLLDVIAYDQLKLLYDKSHTLERIGRLMAEFQFVQEFNRRRVLLQMPALERYEWLEKHQGAVFQHFQLKDIATYLGITPVTLSRLRNQRRSGNA